MKKIALVLAALAATSGAALANDFAATLHYPEAPRVDQAATSSRPYFDRFNPRKFVSGKAATDSKTVSTPAADASNN